MRFGLTSLALALVVLMSAGPAWAGAVAEKTVLTLDGARRVVAAAVAQAKTSEPRTGVIAVVDDGGNVLALERIDGTFAAGANISIGKARTAALFKKPTRFFEKVIREGRTPMVALNDFTPLMGGVPIEIGGQVVGAVGVSGAASAQADDEIATAGANALTSEPSMIDPPCARYFDRDTVASSFASGGMLFSGMGANFAVHTSKRTEPGKVEVHENETDVIYVVDGQATLVTGGQLVNGTETTPGEIRGNDVRGGEERTLSPGDVVIVPAGVPHWFKQVEREFHYYVVKVKS